MSGRALAFADPNIVKMASEDYIAVTGDDWYQRRRQDAEGRFFRNVADQGPRKGEGGSTRQGIYCLTADGQLLTYKNAGQNPEVMREVLRHGLARWRKLPDARRRPGGVKIEDAGTADARYARTLPKDGLALRVFTRALDRDASGKYRDANCENGDAAAQDHCWLTKEEWRSLMPEQPRAGQSFEVPPAIVQRICRFHLIDNTRGEPPMWQRAEIRRQELKVTVTRVEGTAVQMELRGTALLATHADPSKADGGFDARLTGLIEYDSSVQRIKRLDLVAVGDHWGEGTYTRGARPGRAPLGVAFELGDGHQAADSVPPQGARELNEYFGPARR